jgi:hypothetical protein
LERPLIPGDPSPPFISADSLDSQLFIQAGNNITGPNPTNWGVFTFAHEISHYKQGVERLTIQGEMFAQYAGAQIWRDLGEIASDMPHPLFLEIASTSLGHQKIIILSSQ